MVEIKTALVHLIGHVPFYVYALLLVYCANYFYRRTSGFSFHDELTERDNPAFGACLAGYLGGFAIALTGAFPSESDSFADAAISMSYSGVLAILLMRASLWINHELILTKFSIDREMIGDKNVGAGVAVAGSSLGTGFVLAGALTGESSGYLTAIRDIFVYWAVGQALFVVGSQAFFKIAGYDVQKTLEHDNNAAAGFNLGGFLIALGILLGGSLRDASGGLMGELAVTAAVLVICVPLLLFTTTVTQKLIFQRVNLAKEIAIDKNSAAGVICAAASITTAVLLVALISSH